MNDSSSDELSNVALGIFVAALCAAGFGIFAVVHTALRKPTRLKVLAKFGAPLLLVCAAVSLILIKLLRIRGFYGLGISIVGVWSLQALIAILTFKIWKAFLPERSIAPDMADSKVEVKFQAGSTAEAFIGTSMVSGQAIQLCERERAMHSLVSGSTGSGKTTILKSLFVDAVRKGHPVIIIDPKGNNRTIDEFRSIAINHGRPVDSFKVFSIINPQGSCRYNPLSGGTSMQIRDRLMGSLEWSEPFYKHQSSAWLGLALDILYTLKSEISVSRLHRLLTDQETAEALGEECLSVQDVELSKMLMAKYRALSKFDRKTLDGLIAQVRDLDSLEFGQILKPDSVSPAIDLSELIERGEIAYFQLSTMAYEQSAKVIGKLILQDLKSLASRIHGSSNLSQEKFLPIFVDEFGSFAFEGFIDFLKMSRDVKFANHLFFQSLADLDVVSPEFKSQVQQNCLTKIILRTDDPDEVEFWAGVAGTRDAVESSFQIENRFGFRMKTGQGNMRYTKQMRVEHDVFKRLRVGQAVVIQKAPAREDLVQLWNPKL